MTVALGVVAALCAILLLQARPVWIALMTVGLCVFAWSLAVADAKVYWLTIFLATIPLNITKLFYWTPESVSVLKHAYGIVINETMVPQMYLADLPLAMLLVIWLSELVARRRQVAVPRPLLIMVGFVLWCIGSVAMEQAPLLGLSWLVYEVKLMVMFLWFVNAGLGRKEVRRMIAVLLMSLCLQSAVTVATYAMQTGENIWGGMFGATATAEELREGPARGTGAAYVFEEGALRRGTGTIGTANLEAKYLVLLLPLALVAAMMAENRLTRAGATAVFAGGLGALYLTFSRGGMLSALIALGLVPLLLVRAGIWSHRKLVLTAVGALAVAAAAAPLLLMFFNSRPEYGFSRLDHLTAGVELFLRHPIAGVGINNFTLNVSPLEFNGTFAGTPVHNHYLRIANETGLVGFLLYFGFFGWAVRLAYRLSAHRDRFVAITASAMCAGLVGTAVYWLGDLFYDPIVRTQIWVSVALVAVLAQIARRSSASFSEASASAGLLV